MLAVPTERLYLNHCSHLVTYCERGWMMKRERKRKLQGQTIPTKFSGLALFITPHNIYIKHMCRYAIFSLTTSKLSSCQYVLLVPSLCQKTKCKCTGKLSSSQYVLLGSSVAINWKKKVQWMLHWDKFKWGHWTWSSRDHINIHIDLHSNEAR